MGLLPILDLSLESLSFKVAFIYSSRFSPLQHPFARSVLMAYKCEYRYLEWKREKKILLKEWEGLEREVRRGWEEGEKRMRKGWEDGWEDEW
jgi:hypothetical protein